MRKHRNPRQRLTKRSKPSNPKPAPTFDFEGVLAVLRDNVARADAKLVTADELIPQLWSGDSGEGEDNLGLTRRRNHVSYLLEAARESVRAAMHAGDELDLHRGAA